ncbi:hypothetical protein [Noviherbaspirillum aridicola]|uniref:hypothetical protein n=1 Tax=Noviherbaspirillum aridicola TaxID=2849687 RepID=UPI001C81C6BD|nr:hypothetical protein [Noviherbaspirillum aridicola]
MKLDDWFEKWRPLTQTVFSDGSKKREGRIMFHCVKEVYRYRRVFDCGMRQIVAAAARTVRQGRQRDRPVGFLCLLNPLGAACHGLVIPCFL